MASRKQKRRPRVPVDEPGCGKPALAAKKRSATNRRVYRLLVEQRAILSQDERRSFVDFVDRGVRHRTLTAQRWSKNRLKDDDIIRLIQLARDGGELDEAIWRGFLAAHLGRPSANPAIEDQLESASLLLCGFGLEPKWTWNRVRARPKAFRNWLYDHAADLESLSFGNHRKYESKQPDLLWEVIESFVELARKYGGPTELVAMSSNGDSKDPFHVLYRRLSPLHRFGRTARFDFLVTLLDLKLIVAEPKSCYLRGATGPLSGAKRLWGDRAVGELDDLAAELAERLGVSPIVMEDALCNWKK